MLVRMWRNSNPLALLVGMQNGAATLENSTEVLQKTKIRTTIQSSNCIIRYLPKEYENTHSDTCTLMFIAALTIVVELQKHPKYPLIEIWVLSILWLLLIVLL